MITKVYDNFKLPIQFNKESREILDNLDADLELTKTNVGSKISVYEKIIEPTTCFGNECIEPFSKYYTTDVKYIQDTQQICKNITDITISKPLIEDTWKNYDNIKNDGDFLDKYQYIDWKYFKWLNTISIFLLILGLYNLSSPLINLLSPLFVLIVPFFMLKFVGLPVTMNSYYIILLQQLKKHAIGQLFTQWNNVDASKKIYLLFCFGMYFYNIYQNIVSCRRFYRNSHYITNTFNQIKSYLDYTIENMTFFSKIIQPYKSYESFRNKLDENKNKLIAYYNDFTSIPDKVISLKNIPYLGKTMRSFYTIYNSSEFHYNLEYSFAFNGYLDVIKGINNKINNKIINPVKLLENKKSKLDFKDFYHPLIEDKPIKNCINLKKNKIITGPNASGKTTLLKSSIINILICQQFGYGFFQSGKMTTFHNIYCYMNIPDTNGRDSLFQAEARRCLEILRNMDENKNERHFAVFDELYSGTNPYEAISSAYSYLNYISKNKNIKFVLTTHFIKLCELMQKNKKIQNCCMETIIHQDIPQYKYKIIKGISKIKGGICVLKNLNYPDAVIKNTKNILEKI
tara:strand:+ start:2193 stop:3908 length:1716 start_codon:yes stop_codon:yes gene_type:complete